MPEHVMGRISAVSPYDASGVSHGPLGKKTATLARIKDVEDRTEMRLNQLTINLTAAIECIGELANRLERIEKFLQPIPRAEVDAEKGTICDEEPDSAVSRISLPTKRT